MSEWVLCPDCMELLPDTSEFFHWDLRRNARMYSSCRKCKRYVTGRTWAYYMAKSLRMLRPRHPAADIVSEDLLLALYALQHRRCLATGRRLRCPSGRLLQQHGGWLQMIKAIKKTANLPALCLFRAQDGWVHGNVALVAYRLEGVDVRDCTRKYGHVGPAHRPPSRVVLLERMNSLKALREINKLTTTTKG